MNTPLDTPANTGLGRRSFLKRSSLVGAAATAGIMSLPKLANAQGLSRGPGLDLAVLNFALNLEYLEAEYYLYGVNGMGLDAADVGGSGTAGSVDIKANPQVNFTSPAVQQYAAEIARDELAHVRFLRSAIMSGGGTPVARPDIDLQGSFAALGSLIGVPDFDPFASQLNFILGAYIFEDVGVTAYKGAAPLISNKTYLEAAAGILAVEAYHSGSVRTQLFAEGATAQGLANDISGVRDSIDDAPGETATSKDQGILVDGVANIVPADANAIAYSRSTRQVLNIVYGNAGDANGAVPGLFFPNGTNGTIS